MQELKLKPTSKAVKDYYELLKKLDLFHETKEGAVSPAFATLLRHCARQFDLTLVEQYSIRYGTTVIRPDGALVDKYRIPHGYWEAKDTADDLEGAIKEKFQKGYPKDNIIFQAPGRVIIWQGDREILDADINEPAKLVEALKIFFEYEHPIIGQWERAVEQFKPIIPELAKGILKLIEEERQVNKKFTDTFETFYQLCRDSINPNLSIKAVEEMLIQHLMTEHIFRTVLNNPSFVKHNIIAAEIEKVIEALTLQYFSREEFLKKMERFYRALDNAAKTIDDYSQKQTFLNSVYEQFFQGFAVKVADTYGIIYTPQEVVDFMVRSVEDILQKEFGRSLASKDVHIIDPFVGTGSFILRIMRDIPRRKLERKYSSELHCNEVMLLPYYIASMNIEHAYYETMGPPYKPFDGICFVDTFDILRHKQLRPFAEENTKRIDRQRASSIFVVIGNPPYNIGQLKENDNNKNRKYKDLDKRIRETYVKDSRATLKSKAYNTYSKAIRWASDRIGNEGIVAFITDNGFIEDLALDGMRKHLAQDFSKIYHINLKGNARTSGERRKREAGNVFDDMIRVGVGISFFVRKGDQRRPAEIHIHSVEDYLKSEEKKELLREFESLNNAPFEVITPDKSFHWLHHPPESEFDSFTPLGTQKAKRAKSTYIPLEKDEAKKIAQEVEGGTIFKIFSLGVSTNRDIIVYNYSNTILTDRIASFCDEYNIEVIRFSKAKKPEEKEKLEQFIDDFVNYDKLEWSSTLKGKLARGVEVAFEPTRIRRALYRPFDQRYIYYDSILVDRPAHFKRIFPTSLSETENKVICVRAFSSKNPFHCFITNVISDLHLTGDT